MPHYRHKPSIVYAHQLDMPVSLKTPNGDIDGDTGDYLVVDTEGNTTLLTQSLFESVYEIIPGA